MAAQTAGAASSRADPAAPVLLSCVDLRKTYGSTTALSGVEFAVAPGEIVGLCGENGAGKSTLVKIVTGLTAPDDGHVEVNGRRLPPNDPLAAQTGGVALVDQELSLLPDLTVYDNIWIGNTRTPILHRRRALRRRARQLLDDLGCTGISLDALVGSLSMGERQLVEIARMLSRDARVLILDEPTATLSDVEIHRIFTALRALAADGRSVLFVSHRLAEVFDLCHRVVVFRNGGLVADSPIGEIDRTRLAGLMLGRAPADLYPPRRSDAGDVLLSVDELTVPGRLAGVNLHVRAGEIVGVAGQVGSGAGTIVRALSGMEPSAQGRVSCAGRPLGPRSVAGAARAGIRYLSDDRAGEGLFLDHSILRNLTALRLPTVATGGVLQRTRERRTATRLAKAVGVPEARLQHDVGTLSGGNQQKVAVGRLLDLDGARVLLLHEPTRGVDVGSRAEIYRLIDSLARAGHGVLVVSTDLEELVGLCDRIYTLYRGRQISEHSQGAFDSEHVLAEITHGMPTPSPVVEEAR